MNLRQRLHLAWNRFWYHYPKCTICRHSLFDHVLYDEAPSRLGVCVNPCCVDKDVCDSFNVPKKQQYCTRCGSAVDKLYEFDFTDEDGEKIHHKLCWDCDWDVSNGGDIYDDASDIHTDRAERAYEYDPINNPRPW